LKSILRKYEGVEDIIIFGSFVKGRTFPNDVDIAFIVKNKDLSLVQPIKKTIGNENMHIKFIRVEETYSNPLFLSLLKEGYSIKKNDFLRNVLGIRPMKMYIYDLKHLDKSKKTLFGMAVKKNLKKVGGEKIGSGAVLIPIGQTGYFEDFLDVWGMKYKTRELTVI